MKRQIVQIDEEKCDGCGLCVPECAEGAIQVIDGKARLVSETYCDGLGACLGHCPQDAITIVEREAAIFDEAAVEKHLASQNHDQHHSCPSSQAMTMGKSESQLSNWPIQIKLAPPTADYFNNADLLIAADCVSFAYPNFHNLLQDKVLLIGCPKLDEADFYVQKLGQIIKHNDIKSISIAHMEVPCCFGLGALVNKAIEVSGKNLSAEKMVFAITANNFRMTSATI